MVSTFIILNDDLLGSFILISTDKDIRFLYMLHERHFPFGLLQKKGIETII